MLSWRREQAATAVARRRGLTIEQIARDALGTAVQGFNRRAGDPAQGAVARRDRVAAAVVAASAAMESEVAVSHELRRFIVRLHEWMAGPDSSAFYRALTDDEQQRFDRLLVRASILRMRLGDMDLDALAMRVSMQTGLLHGSIGEARKHLEQPLQPGIALAALDRFLETVTNFIL